MSEQQTGRTTSHLVQRSIEAWLMLEFFQRIYDLAERFYPTPPTRVEISSIAVAAKPSKPRVRLIPGVDHIRLSVDEDTVASAHLSPNGRWLLQVRIDLFEGEAVALIPSDEEQLRMTAERAVRLGLPH